jgi:hypothetical protein
MESDLHLIWEIGNFGLVNPSIQYLVSDTQQKSDPYMETCRKYHPLQQTILDTIIDGCTKWNDTTIKQG